MRVLVPKVLFVAITYILVSFLPQPF